MRQPERVPTEIFIDGPDAFVADVVERLRWLDYRPERVTDRLIVIELMPVEVSHEHRILADALAWVAGAPEWCRAA